MILPLLDYADEQARRRARRTDPPTSHQAAREAAPIANAHQRMIWQYLDAIYPRSAIVDEIAKGTGLTTYQTSKRICELERAGKIRQTGDTRPGKSGRQQRAWVTA